MKPPEDGPSLVAGFVLITRMIAVHFSSAFVPSKSACALTMSQSRPLDGVTPISTAVAPSRLHAPEAVLAPVASSSEVKEKPAT